MTYLRLLSLCIISAILSSLTTHAQQLPNNGFEEGWVDCEPYTGGETTKIGKTPNYWTIAHVAGYKVFIIGWSGKTTVGESVNGYNSDKAVKIINSPNSVVKNQTVPGYVTLGTPFNTANTSGNDKDGGSFGGIDFKYRPDALSFAYQRKQVTTPATVIAYIWKGTWTQDNVRVSIGSSPTKVQMTDRERNILGVSTTYGDSPTASSDAKLIASVNERLDDNNENEWKIKSYEFKYETSDFPQKINVIFCAGDYFSDSPEVNNTLTIDDVKLIYYSQLKSLMVDGVGVEGFEADKYDYDLTSMKMPANPENISYELLGEGKSATVGTPTVDYAKGTVTVTVKGIDADANGETEHTYTLRYLPYKAELKTLRINGKDYSPSGKKFTIDIPYSPTLTIEPVVETNCSGNPTATVSSDGKSITVTNGTVTNTYTVSYQAQPFYSRISGVKIGDKTFTLGDDGTTVDATSLPLPMPEVTDVTPILLTGGQGTPVVSKLTRNTEKGTISFSVSNSGADSDGLKKHDYIVQFPTPVISRIKSLEIVGEEFSPTVYEYIVETYLPADDSELGITLFDGTTATPMIERLEPTADNQPLRITLTGSGPDFDGLSSHTYTLLFNLPVDEHRSVRLSSITINGQEVAITSSTTNLTYSLSVDAPALADDITFDYTLYTTDELTADGTEVKLASYNPETGELRITVSNTIPDTDGRRQRTYIFRFRPYLSRLASVTAGGTTIELFSETGEEISADFNFKMPAAELITYTLPENSAGEITVSPVELDVNKATATFRVSNSRPDIDGLAARTYTLYFALPHFSRLSSLALDGEPIENFNPDQFTYAINSILPDDPTVDAEVIAEGQGKPVISEPVIDRSANTIAVTVTNSEPDVDGLASHTYTLTFLAPPTALLSSIAIDGKEIPDFSSDVFTYQLSGLLPSADRITAVALPSTGNLSDPKITVNEATATATITITNGSLRNVYTLRFEKPCPSTLSSITINGTPLNGFSPSTTSYSLTVTSLPSEADITVTATDSRATTSVELNGEVATITVTSPLPGSGAATTVYTIRFTIPSTPEIPDTPDTPPTSNTTVYDGTLTIIMMGEDLTGGGQQARVEITDTDEGLCTFTLPDFSLDLGDGPVALGDIIVENVAVTTAADGTRTFTGSVNGMELADGAIVADVTLSGTSSPENIADMTIRVNWEGIDIDVHFTGQGEKKPQQPSDPETPTGDTTVYDGTLTIIMMGEDLTGGGQQARVEITDTDEGFCTFTLPDFSLDLGDGPVALGDIIVENVTVTTAADGTRTFTGAVNGMELADGAIVADVTLSGTSSPEGVADMTIKVNWEGIDIDVHFTGQGEKKPQQPSDPETPADGWKTAAGLITVELNGYDITEGGTPASLCIREDEAGTYTFLVPSFSLALDAESEPALLGDIMVSDINATPLSASLTRFTGTAPSILLADGSIQASASIDGTISSDSTIVINVDVDWIMESGRHIPIMVRFTNTPRSTASTTPTGYRGVLTANVDGEPDRTFDVTLLITPHSPGRCTATISGLDFSPASRAASIGSEITIPGVCVTPLTGGITGYDGNTTGIAVNPDMTLDAILHGFTYAAGNHTLTLNLLWAEQGIRISGSFAGNVDASVTAITSPTDDHQHPSNEEWYDLNGRRVDSSNLRPGIYIRRTSSSTTKIIVK